MRRILKYELEVSDNQVLEIPSDNILSVQEQNDKVIVYALIDTESTQEELQGSSHIHVWGVVSY